MLTNLKLDFGTPIKNKDNYFSVNFRAGIQSNFAPPSVIRHLKLILDVLRIVNAQLNKSPGCILESLIWSMAWYDLLLICIIHSLRLASSTLIRPPLCSYIVSGTHKLHSMHNLKTILVPNSKSIIYSSNVEKSPVSILKHIALHLTAISFQRLTTRT